MQQLVAAAVLPLAALLVATRVILLKRQGVRAFRFGELDKKDYLIPPFALLYAYSVMAPALGLWLPAPAWLSVDAVRWAGAALCAAGVVLLALSLAAFGRSFRVGIDEDSPGRLVTSGVFSVSRNPIYTGFGLILLGNFLIFTNWIMLVYLAAGSWLLHRQVLREEESLRKIYGEEYAAYCKKVRRYL